MKEPVIVSVQGRVMGGCGVVTVTGGVHRVSEIEPCLMRWRPHLATGRRLRL
jgi:hypothetical protein